jgi:Tol biopolymer transport system component/serine/threonine protein kinase
VWPGSSQSTFLPVAAAQLGGHIGATRNRSRRLSVDVRRHLEESLGQAYAIERELDGGGMSRVFLAEEVALGRRVVVKVLAPDLAEGLSAERFSREIRLAATLQQANIVPLLSTGAAAGLPYYTMPYVDGRSLRSRLDAEGRLSTPETVSILRDVARALAHANARGVIHRDIKPENILLSGGTAVVTDFGIAKAVESARTLGGGELGTVADAAPALRSSERRTALTALGATVGTPAYMAPEQAAGDAVDARTDLYALGCVAYEMLTGASPFAGRAPLVTLAAQVNETPARLSERRPDVPAALTSLVDRMLAKRPEDRPSSANEVVRLLDAVSSGDSHASVARSAAPTRSTLLAGTAVAVAVLGIVAAVALSRARTQPALVIGTTSQVTASPELEVDASISPDGKLVAYAGQHGRALRIFVRQIGGGSSVMVGPDSGGSQRWPRWAPDGASLIYASEGVVYQVSWLGGAPRPLTGSSAVFLRSNPTAAVSPDGRQLAWADSAGILVRPIAGGAARRVVSGFELHSPAWSPDGKRLAYVAGNQSYVNIIGNTSPSSIWTVRLDGGAPVRATETQHLNVSPVWYADGKSLLYVSGVGGIRDIWQLRLRDDGRPIGDPVRLTTGAEPYSISLSGDGNRLAYSVLRQRANIWTAPISATATTPYSAMQPVTRENQRVEGVSLSPDGKWLAYDANRHGNADIFRMPATGGDAVQLTSDPADDFEPAWSPDGKRLAFYSTRYGTRDVFTMDADGGSVERVTSLPGQERFPSWSPDGTRLAFSSTEGDVEDVYVVTRQPSGGWSAATRLTTFGAGIPRWSPDGRWISVVSPRRGVLLVPPEGGEARVVAQASDSAGNVLFAEWGRDPATVYYLTVRPRELVWRFWAVPVTGGKPHLALAFDPAAEQLGGVAFSTDGTRIFYTVTSDESDVWTVELGPR